MPKAKTTLTPIRDQIVVRRDKPADKTPGGIALPDNSRNQLVSRGEVLAIGCGILSANGEYVSLEVSVGDVVFFPNHAGIPITHNEEELLILHEGNVLALLRV